MRDTNLLLTDAAVAADAFSANALDLKKTPAEGLWLQCHVTKTGADADERLDVTFYGKDTDAAWALTDEKVGVLLGGQIGAGLAQNAVVVRYAKIVTDKRFVKPYYDVTGTTPGFTIVCSVVTGPDQITTT
jgi:hypothetical protein